MQGKSIFLDDKESIIDDTLDNVLLGNNQSDNILTSNSNGSSVVRPVIVRQQTQHSNSGNQDGRDATPHYNIQSTSVFGTSVVDTSVSFLNTNNISMSNNNDRIFNTSVLNNMRSVRPSDLNLANGFSVVGRMRDGINQSYDQGFKFDSKNFLKKNR